MSSAEFLQAAEQAKSLATKPSNDDLLELYALFKQATVGDCTTPQPGMFELTAKAKWNSWVAKKGMAKADAEKEYVAKVASLKA